MNYELNPSPDTEQVVELTFQNGEFSAERSTTVRGNVTGLTVIKHAVAQVYEELWEMGMPVALLELHNGDETQIISDDFDRGEGWLEDMLVYAEITEAIYDA